MSNSTLPMFREPTPERVAEIVASQRDRAVTYEPKPYTRHHREPIGDDFATASAALAHWRQYDLGWTRVAEPRPEIEVGNVSATVAKVMGGWTVNCCRIVEVCDEDDAFGYTIGTLPHHSEIGEERFRVERIGRAVFYDVQSHSVAGNWLVKLFWPMAERAVRRFLRESGAHMSRMCGRREVK